MDADHSKGVYIYFIYIKGKAREMKFAKLDYFLVTQQIAWTKFVFIFGGSVSWGQNILESSVKHRSEGVKRFSGSLGLDIFGCTCRIGSSRVSVPFTGS